MKKKMKGIIGLCLVAALAFGGVGRYAQAGMTSFNVLGNDGIIYHAVGGSSIGERSGTAYTSESGSAKCHCSVSATFTWLDEAGEVAYTNGDGAGGMHGASVSITYNGDPTKELVKARVSASHTMSVTTGGYDSGSSSDVWTK